MIEVDGGIHDRFEVKERDEGREEELQNLGLTIIRFTNEEVLNDIDGVLSKLKSAITAPTPASRNSEQTFPDSGKGAQTHGI